MSEKDYRANYLTKVGIPTRKAEVIDVHADEIDLDRVRSYLYQVSPSNKITNRPQIWQFLTGVIPRYKTVRLHTQEQLQEQWSVIEKAARLILSLSADHETTQYLYALHLIHTGSLSLMNETHDITCGSRVTDQANVLLIRHLLVPLKLLKLNQQYFVVHEILELLSKINSRDAILQKVVAIIQQTDPQLARKLHSPEVRTALTHSIRTCFAKALPSCCFARLIDYTIAKRDASMLVNVGVESLLRNGPINKQSGPMQLAEGIKSAILVTQSHSTCLSSFINKTF